MAGGQEYSRSQRKIIDRYYQHEDTIVAQRLGEIVGDLALAAGDEKKLKSLWARAEKALAKTSLSEGDKRRVLESRDPELLGRLLAKLAR